MLQRQGVRIADHRLHHARARWSGTGDQLAGRVRVAPIDQAAAGDLRGDAAGRRRGRSPWCTPGSTGRASYDTTGIGGENVAASLAALPTRPDVVVVGHSHREMRDSVLGGVHFVQPRPFGASVSVVHLDLARDDGALAGAPGPGGPGLDRGASPPSPLLAQRLAAARDSVRAWARTPIGLAARRRCGPARRGSSRRPILEFVHDVQRRRTGAELSGGLGVRPPGRVRRRHDPRRRTCWRSIPFDNTLRAVRVSGAQLKAYLEWSARYFRVDPVGRIALNDSVPGYNYDMVAGAQLRHRPAAAGRRPDPAT